MGIGAAYQNFYFYAMASKKKTIPSIDKESGKNAKIYWWIIIIGILLMIVVWLYFEEIARLEI